MQEVEVKFSEVRYVLTFDKERRRKSTSSI